MMHTLFDFITYIKGVEYILAILFIVGFILYWEILKPRPFRTVLESGREDLDFIRKEGYRSTLRSAGMAAAAPFIGLLYLVALPFVFFFAVGHAIISGVARLVGASVPFGWRPAESYLAGKKQTGSKATADETKPDANTGGQRDNTQ